MLYKNENGKLIQLGSEIKGRNGVLTTEQLAALGIHNFENLKQACNHFNVSYYEQLSEKEKKAWVEETGWESLEHKLRIVAPTALIDQYPDITKHFVLLNLPIKVLGETTHLYCNEIMSEHQGLVDMLQGVITIESK